MANFLLSLSVKEFFFNRLRFDKVTAIQSLGLGFFGTRCRMSELVAPVVSVHLPTENGMVLNC